MLAAALLLCGCTETDEWVPGEGYGALQLSLSGISTTVETTRSTPAELGKPSPEDFHLTVVRESNGITVYDGPFTEGRIPVAPDSYTITATYGSNQKIGLDTPYYSGSTTATVTSLSEPTSVHLPVSVANALVSAVFGESDEETARFSRFYDNYGVNVIIGDDAARISGDLPHKSVYVRAGSTIALTFSGYHKALKQQVTMPIQLPDELSYTLAAADHVILTLALEPNAESAVVTVVKGELEHVGIDDKISYNWLPKPVVHTEHKYIDGKLMGTDVSIDASFPDATWEARIHQGTATGNVVRTLTGSGALTSSYLSENEWPYLPPGEYVATYRYYSRQGKAYNFSKTTTFTVPAAALTLEADAYTAHSRYEAGDVDGANACERLTLYHPSARWNIDESLLRNANYAKTFRYSIGSQTFTAQATSPSMTFADIAGVPVSGTPYTFTVTGTFAGQTVTGSKQVRITGLPYSMNLGSHSEWSEDGKVSWNADAVQLGNYSTGGQSITTSSSVFIPKTTKYCANYSVNLHCATVGTTFSITAGSQVILSIKESGGTFLVGTDNPHNGTTNTFAANSDITTVTCDNSYGAGGTSSYIYSLTLKYGQ